MKKLIAALSAVTMLLGIVPMGASAYNDIYDLRNKEVLTKKSFFVEKERYFYSPGDYIGSGIEFGSSNGMSSFLLITDGTEPPEESFTDIPDFKECKTLEISHDDYDVAPYWSLKLPDGTIAYEVKLSGSEHLVDSARQYFLKNAFVENVYLTREHVFDTGSWRLEDGFTLEGIYPEEGILGLKNYSRNNNRVELDEPYLTELSAYEDGSCAQIARALEICNQIQEQSNDWIMELKPALSECDLTNNYVYHNYSVWLDLGDADGNTAVNTSDAAIVLQEAARAGAGDAEAGQNLDVMDVNLDGTVNASDAACILIYAAQAGANGSADWQNILR